MMKKGVFLFLVMCMAVLSLEAGEGYTTVNRFKGKRISGLDVSGIWEIQLSQGKQTGLSLLFRNGLRSNWRCLWMVKN